MNDSDSRSSGLRYLPLAEKILFVSGILVVSITTISLIALVVAALVIDGYASRSVCLSAECIKNFLSGFKYPLLLLQTLGACAVGFATTYGLIVALRVYASNSEMVRYQAESAKVQADSLVEQAKSAALQLHSVRFSSFREYISEEISRCSRVDRDCVDVTTWYFKIHPNSIDGDISFNIYYIDAISKIADAMKKSDESLGPSRNRFRYRDHQKAIIPLLAEVGIKIDHLPRLDYFLVEDEIISMILSVHRVFGVPSTSFGLRSYRTVS